MTIRLLLAGVALVACASLAACSKKEEAKPAAKNDKAPPKEDKKTPPVVAPDAAPVAAAPDPGAGKLTCDELVPAALREKHMAGYELDGEKQMDPAKPNNVFCSFQKKAEYKTNYVSTICYAAGEDPTSADGMADVLKKKLKKPKELKAGKKAYLGGKTGTNGQKESELILIDDDTACVVAISFSVNAEPANPEAYAQDLAAALTPAVLSN